MGVELSGRSRLRHLITPWGVVGGRRGEMDLDNGDKGDSVWRKGGKEARWGGEGTMLSPGPARGGGDDFPLSVVHNVMNTCLVCT